MNTQQFIQWNYSVGHSVGIIKIVLSGYGVQIKGLHCAVRFKTILIIYWILGFELLFLDSTFGKKGLDFLIY